VDNGGCASQRREPKGRDQLGRIGSICRTVRGDVHLHPPPERLPPSGGQDRRWPAVPGKHRRPQAVAHRHRNAPFMAATAAFASSIVARPGPWRAANTPFIGTAAANDRTESGPARLRCRPRRLPMLCPRQRRARSPSATDSASATSTASAGWMTAMSSCHRAGRVQGVDQRQRPPCGWPHRTGRSCRGRRSPLRIAVPMPSIANPAGTRAIFGGPCGRSRRQPAAGFAEKGRRRSAAARQSATIARRWSWWSRRRAEVAARSASTGRVPCLSQSSRRAASAPAFRVWADSCRLLSGRGFRRDSRRIQDSA
jgi:hypothetical protein